MFVVHVACADVCDLFVVYWKYFGCCRTSYGGNFHKKIQEDTTVYQNFISYLYEAQHVSGDTPPIIKSLKLH